MKIRTLYFKISHTDSAVSFWRDFLSVVPHKNSPSWIEFRCGHLNLALLPMQEFALARDAANCVPVFEVDDDQLLPTKIRALSLGARVIIEADDHPDGMSYVLADPCGNEFEITGFHD